VLSNFYLFILNLMESRKRGGRKRGSKPIRITLGGDRL
jgi:hypothetical protein